MLCGDRTGWLADAAELLRPLSSAGCGHVAGAAGGRSSQPWLDSAGRLRLHTSVLEGFVFQCWCYHCDTVDQELSFQDKYLFYRFLDDEQEDALFPSEEESRESQEELQDTLLLLSQIGPDAHMRMILRKQYESHCLTLVILQLTGCCDVRLCFSAHLREQQMIWRSFMKNYYI